MKTAAIITNFNIYKKAELAQTVAEKLVSRSVNVIVDSTSAKAIARNLPHFPHHTYVQPDKLCSSADFVGVLGGDGTIIDSLKRSASSRTPVIGINMGRLGFLAEIEPNEIDLLDKVIDGNYHTEEREMLFVQLFSESGKKRFADFAANEAVISNGSIPKIVDLKIYEKGTHITDVRADGIILSTPTGSTAYSLSAGGPVIDPRVNCICLTPICPHSLTIRPIIFPEKAVIDVLYLPQRENNLFLTLDGRKNIEMNFGDRVAVSKANKSPLLIRIKEHSFYTKLSTKLN